MKLDIETLAEKITQGTAAELIDLLDRDPRLVNARNEQGISYLMLTLYYHKSAHTQAFMERRQQFNLFEAAALDLHESTLQHLEAEHVDTYAPDGFTPLMLASFFARPAMVRLLLDQGANPNLTAQNGAKMTALHSAAAARSLPVMMALLNAGADVNAQQTGGYTPLMSVAAHGEQTLVKHLRTAGADPAIKNDEGKTALEMALAEGHELLVPLLDGP